MKAERRLTNPKLLGPEIVPLGEVSDSRNVSENKRDLSI